MTWQEAEQKMDEIAGEKYYSIGYKRTALYYKKIQECQLYLEPSILVTARTWEKAFALLEARISGGYRVEDIGHCPELEADV